MGKGASDERKQGVIFGLGVFSLGKRKGRFLPHRLPLLSMGVGVRVERDRVSHDLPGTWPENPSLAEEDGVSGKG